MRWQYRIVDLGVFWARDRLVHSLAALGSEGWELVGIYDKSSNWLEGMEKGFALFKRSVPEDEEPAGPWAEASRADVYSPSTQSNDPFAPPAHLPHRGEACPKCGSTKFRIKGFGPAAQATCKQCGTGFAREPNVPT